MKAAPLLVAWHNENAPIYSAHFERYGSKARLATAGGDNNVRLWKIEANGEERKITYLSTLSRHAQAVNVVRWAPKSELLASASDDGNVVLWTPAESQTPAAALGDDDLQDKEFWRVKRMCRSPTESEIYDLAWSPDGAFFVTGSMDNIARIYDTSTGNMIRQIAEHNHYVQGVAWDPLNEYLATQSSDRSVHIYSLRSRDGQFSLAQHNKITKIDLPPRRISAGSPAPPELASTRSALAADMAISTTSSIAMSSPAPSIPGTPTSLSVSMNPPAHLTHSRRSSFGSPPSVARSASPAPSLPLPAVMPSASPNLHAGLGLRNTNIYANETLTSFFRRLTFTPDGSLLLTPAGQYKTAGASAGPTKSAADDVINTVYIYTRAGLNKPPVAHLPGHKKSSVAVRCSPILYTLRAPAPTKNITIDTSSTSEEIPDLPEALVPPRKPTPSQSSSMDPPPSISAPSPSSSQPPASPKPVDDSPGSASTPGPPPAFALPYRVVYAVATQDAVYIYDTQQQTPICVVSNLHFATFTDLTWSADGLTLLMTSSDGFCSTLSFNPGELGTTYHGPMAAAPKPPPQSHPHNHTHSHHHHHSSSGSSNSHIHTTPTLTPTTATSSVFAHSKRQSPTTATAGTISSMFAGPSPPASLASARPASPTRSNSASSIATQSSFAPTPAPIISNPTPSFGAVPSVAAAQSAPVLGITPLTTPPQTPSHHATLTHHSSSHASSPGIHGLSAVPASIPTKRSDSAREESSTDGAHDAATAPKRRRVAPTLVTDTEADARNRSTGQGGSQ